MPEGNDYHALQREQNERIKSLETKVEDLEEDNKRLMGEETERLKGRIRQLEKWVAGAGAVIAVAMAGLGLVEVTDFGFAKTAKQVEEHREYLVFSYLQNFNNYTNSQANLSHNFHGEILYF